MRGRIAHQPGGAARPTERATPPRRRTRSSNCWPTCPTCGTSRWTPSPTDCAPSRFTPEGSHEPVIDFVKTPDDQARRRRGPLYLTRHHGRADPARRAGSHRRARGPRSPTHSCRARSTKAGSRTSASASAATSASRAGTTVCRCAARRIRPSARNGAADGIRSAFAPRRQRGVGARSWAAARPASSAR